MITENKYSGLIIEQLVKEADLLLMKPSDHVTEIDSLLEVLKEMKSDTHKETRVCLPLPSRSRLMVTAERGWVRQIKRFQILHPGEDWSANQNFFPQMQREEEILIDKYIWKLRKATFFSGNSILYAAAAVFLLAAFICVVYFV